jgi:hypothetical protein
MPQARTITSLTSHVQQLLLQVLKDNFYNFFKQRRAAEEASGVESINQWAEPLPMSVKQVNAALGLATSDDKGLAVNLLSLPYDEGFALVSGLRMNSEYLDLKVGDRH